jgi:hypothetical protein
MRRIGRAAPCSAVLALQLWLLCCVTGAPLDDSGSAGMRHSPESHAGFRFRSTPSHRHVIVGAPTSPVLEDGEEASISVGAVRDAKPGPARRPDELSSVQDENFFDSREDALESEPSTGELHEQPGSSGRSTWLTGIRSWLGFGRVTEDGSVQGVSRDGKMDRSRSKTASVESSTSEKGGTANEREGESVVDPLKANGHQSAGQESLNDLDLDRGSSLQPTSLEHRRIGNNSASDSNLPAGASKSTASHSVWNQDQKIENLDTSSATPKYARPEDLARSSDALNEASTIRPDLSDAQTRRMVRTFLKLFEAIDKHIDRSLTVQKQQLRDRKVRHGDLSSGAVVRKGWLRAGEPHRRLDRNAELPIHVEEDEDQHERFMPSGDDGGTGDVPGTESARSYVSSVVRKNERGGPSDPGVEVVGQIRDGVRMQRRHQETEDEEDEELIERSGLPRSAPAFSARKKLLHSQLPKPIGFWMSLASRVNAVINGGSQDKIVLPHPMKG